MAEFLLNWIMILLALLLLPFRAFSVFFGFTFTDFEDFLPLFSLLIGVAGIFLIRRSSVKKVSVPLMVLLCVLSLWPLLPNAGLYFMARELQFVHGSWPQVMVDDPKNRYGHVSPRYDELFHVVEYLDAFSGAWMVLFLLLFFAINSRLSTSQRRLCLSLAGFAMFVFIADPGRLYEWWMD